MALELKIGLDSITSYRRLAYSPWHAIAEFVDNATQSYFNCRQELDDALARENERLEVRIVYERDNGGLLRVFDNAMGMSYEELERALHVGLPPENTSGRSKYGMGLKTAASWIGNIWSVRTKKLGETVEHQVTIDVDVVSKGGNGALPYSATEGVDPGKHYTILEIRKHNRIFQGRTLGKIKDYLRSMYRVDLRSNGLVLEWQHEPLEWVDFPMLADRDGNEYRKDFSFDVNGSKVDGWVGILKRGSRANAGFSVLHCGRVVRGWPDAWRPSSLYGQIHGSNDLTNQRLVGEINLDAFEVSHTKDDILWLGDEEERVEEELYKHCSYYREIAKKPWKETDDGRGPSQSDVDVAVDEFRKELESPEMLDRLEISEVIPPYEVVRGSLERITKSTVDRPTTFGANIGDLAVKGYIEGDLSTNDPYVVIDTAAADHVIVLINKAHPHWAHLKGSDGVLNYLRECTYDGIAEWRARQKAGRVDPDTIKLLKDQLLRVPFEIEMHAIETAEEGA
ncbi:MAG TPA: ATP-binding protein [Gammaproteobacteria bacterium]|nr:ATP-binding protein [Gammaproteobacteria bacterium]